MPEDESFEGIEVPRGETFKRWWIRCGVCRVEQDLKEENHRFALDKARNQGWRRIRERRLPDGRKVGGWICPEDAAMLRELDERGGGAGPA